MIQKRETKDDLIKQTRLLEVFSKQLNLQFNQFSSFSKKYRIDGYCYDIHSKNISCWVECKWYSNKAHCFINVPKFNELISLSKSTSLPSYLLFREYNRWGYILLHDGRNIVCNYEIKLMGGTPNGRIANDDDIEPLIILSRENIVWGN
tara:strand:+ start:221 stop:667 length:447 start_codon:yes stop_codon:yes gene_type:complete